MIASAGPSPCGSSSVPGPVRRTTSTTSSAGPPGHGSDPAGPPSKGGLPWTSARAGRCCRRGSRSAPLPCSRSSGCCSSPSRPSWPWVRGRDCRSRSARPGDGALVYAADGDIFRLEIAAGVPSLIVGGPTDDHSPMYSRDGTKLLFRRSVGRGLEQVLVAPADGSTPRIVTSDLAEIGAIDWSPDRTQFAVLHLVLGHGALSIVDATGKEPIRTLDLGDIDPRDWIAWRPETGGRLFKGERVETGEAAIFAVDEDGSSVGPVTPLVPDEASTTIRRSRRTALDSRTGISSPASPTAERTAGRMSSTSSPARIGRSASRTLRPRSRAVLRTGRASCSRAKEPARWHLFSADRRWTIGR